MICHDNFKERDCSAEVKLEDRGREGEGGVHTKVDKHTKVLLGGTILMTMTIFMMTILDQESDSEAFAGRLFPRARSRFQGRF